LLLIAAANFINLTTAHAESRGIEVGVRKAIGASRQQLISQFLTESGLIALLAAGTALIGSRFFLEPLSTYLGMSIPQSDPWVSVLDLVLLTAFQMLVSCTYPALYLSGLRPTAALAGRQQQGSGLSGRKSLVVFQFAVSAVLIVSTIAMSRQISLITEKDLGYDQEQLMWIPLGWADRTLAERRDVVRGAFERHPSVLSATCASTTVGRYSPNIRFQVGPENRREETVDMTRILSDTGFLKTIGLTLADGNDFNRDEGQE
jgi:putative ABC transport system permease protein